MTTDAQPQSHPPAPLLIGAWSAELETRDGVQLKIRPAAPEDEGQLIDFFAHVAPEDLRLRFLTSVRAVGHDLVRPLVELDHTRTENFLAFGQTGLLLATAMVAAEPDLSRAEVAIAVRADYKHRGLGWTLLAYVADYAKGRGIRRLESVECCDNREAIGLEREMGFRAQPCPGDAALTLVSKELASAGAV